MASCEWKWRVRCREQVAVPARGAGDGGGGAGHGGGHAAPPALPAHHEARQRLDSHPPGQYPPSPHNPLIVCLVLVVVSSEYPCTLPPCCLSVLAVDLLCASHKASVRAAIVPIWRDDPAPQQSVCDTHTGHLQMIPGWSHVV